ncbi:MAG TPA: DNA translocase FtsK 4TM domain-containing protein, partial [Methylophilaceae bacterium]|nr:DNA translocase FtsK 4TM domain-containing protein [Methylophilaceae bacterium]
MFFQKSASSATARREPVPEKTAGLLREAWWLLLVVVGSYLATVLTTYHRNDPGWSHSASDNAILHNAGGAFGAWLSDILLYLFGISAWWLVALAFYSMWLVYLRLENRGSNERPVLFYNLSGFVMLLIASSALEAMHLRGLHAALPLAPGGMLGAVVQGALGKAFGHTGATMALLLAFATGFSLFTGWSWLTITEKIGAAIDVSFFFLRDRWRDWQDRKAGAAAEQLREEYVESERKRTEDREPVQIEPPQLDIPRSSRVEKERQAPLFDALPDSPLPPL